MAQIRFEAVTRHFSGAGAPAVAEVDLVVESGEFLALVGPPESGKTTLLRLVAGLEVPDRGRILIDGRPSHEGPSNVALVFQNYALHPHLSVSDNIGYPLRMGGLGAKQIAVRVAEVAVHLELDGLLKRPVNSLSTSERMRITLARSLVGRPEVLLMDEPLANLEPEVRIKVRDQLVAAHRALGVTTLYATTDPDEANAVAQRVARLEHGSIAGISRP